MALPDIKTILYTTSLNEHSRPVFRHAVQLARQSGARIHMLHVVEPVGEMGHALISSYLPEDLVKRMHDEGIQQVLDKMRQRVEAFMHDELEALPDAGPLEVEPHVAEGPYADTILDQAEKIGADVIIMGAENRFGHHGHTASQVIRHATVPVYVVPTGKQYL
ncbi:universal stress protein [Marinobacterium sp. AK62]|uniref:Universal stress protein n=1 Tax=Marinobacterium alkalitolerans TaxID=1542925 RepID=A0ABS3ZAW1_9GAMM|nr:universal stress protein [Marinobacterium alkalitolerans]MBP0048495.1 universal stress protein [Marinobacterium alkalitolerans]